MAVTNLGKANVGGVSVGGKSATECWVVQIDTSGDWNSALGATGLPRKGSAHATRPWLKCDDVYARPLVENSLYLALVTAPYSGDNADRATAPWDETPTFQVTSIKTPIVAEKYWDPTDSGSWKPNANTAGEVFDPPQMVNKINDLLTITKNYKASGTGAFSGPAAAAFKGAVNNNSQAILGRTNAAYKYLIHDITYTKLTYLSSGDLVYYYQVTFTIEYDPDGIGIEQLNVGYKQLTAGKLVSIIDPKTNRVLTRPWKLQADGSAYSEAQQSDPASFYMIPRRLFAARLASFSTLNLPAAE